MDGSPETRPETWDSVATSYDRSINTITRLYVDDLFDVVSLTPDSRVLDVACGTGAASLAAAKSGANVVATDFSAEMVEQTKRLLREAGLDLEVHQMDGHALAFEDSTFDAVTCAFGLMFFADPHKGVSEMFRVLKPGGRAGILTWAQPAKVPGISMWRRTLDLAFPERDFPSRVPPIFSLSDPAMLSNLLDAAGFIDVSIQEVTRNWPFSSAEDYWTRVPFGSPAIADVAPTERDIELFHDATIAYVEEHFGSGPIEIPGTALLATAKR